MTNEKRKAIVNIENLVVWRRIYDSEGNVSYGEANEIIKSLMSFSYTPTFVSDELCGDGEVVDTYAANMGGTLEIGLTGLTKTDRILFFGENSSKNSSSMASQGTPQVTISSSDDIPNYLVVAFLARHNDDSATLFKYPKVRFTPGQESAQQRTRSGITWSTKTISGTCNAEDDTAEGCHTGAYRVLCEKLNPNDIYYKATLEKWFGEATCYDFVDPNVEVGE